MRKPDIAIVIRFSCKSCHLLVVHIKIKEFLSNKQTAPFIRQKLFFILSIKNIVHNKRGYRTIDFPPRSAKLIFHPSQCHNLLHTHLIKQRDHTSHTKNRNHRSDSHADQFVSKHEAHRDRDTDIAQIKAVFCKSNRFSDRICDCLYDSVSRIWHDSHI